MKLNLLFGRFPCQGKLVYEPFTGCGGFLFDSYKIVLDCSRTDIVTLITSSPQPQPQSHL